MPSSLTIHSLKDVPAFLEQVAVWHHQECERQGLRSSLALRQQRLQLHLQQRPVPHTLVALWQGHLAGCVSLVNYHLRQEQSAASLSPIWLSNLFVREAWRRQGIGTALVEAGTAYVRNLGRDDIWLSAAEYTDFYRKRGWQQVRATRLGGRQVNILRLAPLQL